MLFIAGAHQSRPASVVDRDHEPLYDRGLLAGPDGVVARYRTEDGLPGQALKGLSRTPDGNLLACTEREVLELGVMGEVRRRWSDPRLNDTHHVVAHDGRFFVASTGTDAVLVFKGEEVAVHPLAGPLPSGDLRGQSLKPHQVHPNHLFVWQDQVWITCLHQGHARSLQTGERLDVDDERIHDGVVHEGQVWFTTVDGRVVRTDGRQRQVIDINTLDEDGPLGWCRGLAFDGELLVVGFTRLRATRWRHHLAWVRGAIRGRVEVSRRPTRLVWIDVHKQAIVRQLDVEPLGVHAIFGLV